MTRMVAGRPGLGRGLGFCALLLCAGCVYAPTPAERSASFAPFTSAQIYGESAADFLRDRFAFIVSGQGAAVAGSDQEHSNLILGGKVGLGSACAVDPRGYFATAAHCVEGPGPFFLLKTARDGKVQFASVRVVWAGDKRGLDFAVIFAPQIAGVAFDWADRFHPGDPVLAAGLAYSSRSRVTLITDNFAGTVVSSVDLPDGTLGGQLVLYTGPGHQGDSGGPLITPDGRLIAITVGDLGGIRLGNTEFRVPFYPLRARAIRPDVKWMRKIIEEDRRAHMKRNASTFRSDQPLGIAATSGLNAGAVRFRPRGVFPDCAAPRRNPD